MTNTSVLFDVKQGFLIDGKVAILYGTGSPTGSVINTVGIGSLWLSESDGSIFKKQSMATGSESWTRITEVPRKNTVIESVSSETVIDQEYTSEVTSLTWQVILSESTDPQSRRFSSISCIHDGGIEEEANNLSFEEHSILYSRTPYPNALVGVNVKVELFGDYPNQVFQLVVTPQSGVTVNVVATRLMMIPEDNRVTVSFGEASESVIGLVRLASISEVNEGTKNAVVTAEHFKSKVTELLALSHSALINVTDTTVKSYDVKYNPVFLTVYLNRLKLRPSEYEATNGVSIRFLIDLEVDDEIEVVTIPIY